MTFMLRSPISIFGPSALSGRVFCQRALGQILFMLMVLIGSMSSALCDSTDKNRIKQIIISEAQKSVYVTPAIALAVAETESSFRSDVVSHKGAVGVMQIMPRTARLEFGLSRQALFDARTNIRTGIRFLDQLAHQYKGRMHFALSHYNGGSRVGAWPHSKVLPYTRDYVVNVLDRAKKYQIALADGSAYDKTPDYERPILSALPKGEAVPSHKFVVQDLDEAEIWLEIIAQMRDSQFGDTPIKMSALSRKMQANRDGFRNRLGLK